ncbi:hypothetical protein HK101_010336 [Irineochytrium annulatum]|nr:hypothetical protein HK101_010336 [Irineochytrium annulatum]
MDVYRCTGRQFSYVPPFACSYNNVANDGRYLAVADEAGSVGVIDTNSDNRAETEESPRFSFDAHENAIFDLCWTSDDRFMVTVSGDQTGKLWDVETQTCVNVFQGHTCSVKSIANNPADPNVFATASRDGSIMTWDVRCTGYKLGTEYHQKPVDVIKDAHSHHKPAPKSKKKDQKKDSPPTHGVTAVRFLTRSTNQLASAGAADGLIKFWDIRSRSWHRHQEVSKPFAVSSPVNSSLRDYGFSSLTLNNCGSRIYATCADSSVHEYNTLNLSQPTRTLSSSTLRISSFYVRACISPDDRFLACGSTDYGVHVWDLHGPSEVPVILNAHGGEVTGTSWSKTLVDGIGELASCSDDLTVRVWRWRPNFEEEVEDDAALRHMRGRAREGERRAVKVNKQRAVLTPLSENACIDRKRRQSVGADLAAKRTRSITDYLAKKEINDEGAPSSDLKTPAKTPGGPSRSVNTAAGKRNSISAGKQASLKKYFAGSVENAIPSPSTSAHDGASGKENDVLRCSIDFSSDI